MSVPELPGRHSLEELIMVAALGQDHPTQATFLHEAKVRMRPDRGLVGGHADVALAEEVVEARREHENTEIWSGTARVRGLFGPFDTPPANR